MSSTEFEPKSLDFENEPEWLAFCSLIMDTTYEGQDPKVDILLAALIDVVRHDYWLKVRQC